MTDEELRKIDAPVKGKEIQTSPRQIKINTFIFSLLSSLILIIFSLTLIVSIWFLWMYVFISLLNIQTVFVHRSAAVVGIGGGLFLGFQLYKIVVRNLIKLFHLQNKLSQDVVSRYDKKIKK